jgi:hypothetical protein
MSPQFPGIMGGMRTLMSSIIQGKVEDIELPVKHVDVIVSEWMVCPPMSLHSVMTTDE